MKTLLLSMPFGAVDRPALGISLLKAVLNERGLECEVGYPFARFCDQIGLDCYRWLTDELPYTAFVGDWCFTLPLYGRQADRDWAYVQQILRGTWQLSTADIRRIVQVRETTPAFLNCCLRSYNWQQYQVVGFTSTFVQNLSSLALASRLKETWPHIKIVFGGANWEGEMGKAMHELFPFVDYVCRGEADETFPRLVEALACGYDVPENKEGLIYRDAAGKSLEGNFAEPLRDLDALPIPDFDDYFEMQRNEGLSERVSPSLLMETSRGCWWGAKQHCTFCGLNGQNMAFRSKSSGRAISELCTLSECYEVPFFHMVDNILDMQYFQDFLPELARQNPPVVLFYETKANLSRSQVRLLAAAGVRSIQPGIESMSDHVLALMRKGTTALRNIQLLKWCREYGVSVEWNILYGFPGETEQDYRDIMQVMRSIMHLQAPSAAGPIRVDRFSPYFNSPQAFGLDNLRPLPVFQYLYPFSEKELRRIACYFDVDYSVDRICDATIAELNDLIEDWRTGAVVNDTTFTDDGETLMLQNQHGERFSLAGFDREVYLLCDTMASPGKLAMLLNKRHSQQQFDPASIEVLLNTLVGGGLVATADEKYLALAVPREARLASSTDGEEIQTYTVA